MDRIQKIIAASGLMSRRKAEEMISAGRVTCNGQVCLLGEQADPDMDIILVDGKPLPSIGEYTYIMLHKPRGYVTTLHDEKGRPNAAQLVANCGKRVYPVGRLDMDSEGLLIFTNDGDFANRLMHPRHRIDKVYRVLVSDCTVDSLKRLGEPVELDGYLIAKPTVRLISAADSGRSWVEVSIHEGRNRQVRRMCAAAGMTVHRLVRIREGELSLGQLPLGKWRYLTVEEIRLLRE